VPLWSRVKPFPNQGTWCRPTTNKKTLFLLLLHLKWSIITSGYQESHGECSPDQPTGCRIIMETNQISRISEIIKRISENIDKNIREIIKGVSKNISRI